MNRIEEEEGETGENFFLDEQAPLAVAAANNALGASFFVLSTSLPGAGGGAYYY